MPSGAKKGAKYNPKHTRGYAARQEMVDGRGDLAQVIDKFATQLAFRFDGEHHAAHDSARELVIEIARHLLFASSLRGLESALEEVDRQEHLARAKARRSLRVEESGPD